MESLNTDFIFQTDSTLVQTMYEKDNYRISFNPNAREKDVCVVYFSSHNIYYPNTEEVFRKKIIEKDAYEWYGTRIETGYKHIFIRDIQKQWYIQGINKRINSPEKLLDFLKKECEGYRIITVGSSAGGYAAALYGSQLGAEKVFSFNGQFELDSLLLTSNSRVDPLVFKMRKERKFYDLNDVIISSVPIYYFVSLGSTWDRLELEHVKGIKNIAVIGFRTRRHGIPFVKSSLKTVINLEEEILEKVKDRTYYPILFSVYMDGFFNTCFGLIDQIKKLVTKSQE